MNWLNDASCRTAYRYEHTKLSSKNRQKTAALHNTLPLIVHMHLKRYAKTFAEKEQAKKKRKAYDQDLQWNHYRRKNMEKKNIPPKSVVSGYRRKSVEDWKPIKFKPHNSLRTPYQFEPHADSKPLSSIENLQLIWLSGIDVTI